MKNSYDAGSERVEIEITNVFSHRSLRNTMARIDSAMAQLGTAAIDESETVSGLVLEISRLVDQEAPEVRAREFRDGVAQAGTLAELRQRLQQSFEQANRIEVSDTGEGMSLEDLAKDFLTIGTRSRLENSPRHYVGGKGIGRLSAMRLGDHLTVISSRAGDTHLSRLDIDWRLFSHDSSASLEEIPIRPALSSPKVDPSRHGTRIILTNLKADWDVERVRRLARLQFDRLFDPFQSKARFPIRITVNGSRVSIPTFDRRLLEEAQAKGELRYFTHHEHGPRLVFDIEYLAYGRTKQFVYDQTDLMGITSNDDVSLAAMQTLGDFSAHFHWFNRQRLGAVDGIGTRGQVRDMVNHWANGLLMYRDGFRVNPYGAPDDDWLGIDFKALASSGYKVNRKQLIGAVNISAAENPYLIDQTNREGLRSNEEKTLLVLMLRKAITEDFRNFLNSVEREEKRRAQMDVKDTSAFLGSVSARTRRTLKQLRNALPDAHDEEVDFLEETFSELEERLKTARDAVKTAESDQRDLVNLAGIGLLVEIVSHELGRVTRRTLELISGLDRSGVTREVSATFDGVESQMHVIRKRLDMLDPLSPSGRNRRERFDLRELVQEVLDSHAGQFSRYGISPNLLPRYDEGGGATIRAVRGMIVQILENLIDNSVFWLRQKSRQEPSFEPRITVELDIEASELRFTDNGPGIAVSRAEDVFRPFISSKPPGEGKGLGLYISKEIARYHECDLYLLDDPKDGRLNTFVLDFGELSR